MKSWTLRFDGARAVMAMRAQYKELFERRYGVKLGFMGLFVKACIQALREIPAVNAEIDGEEIIYKNYYHIGVAAGTPCTVRVVPVSMQDFNCHVEVVCNGRTLYGSSYYTGVSNIFRYDLERGGAPRLCHRLDRETSGIVLVGKHPEAHADVMKQFERRKVEKEYLTIVAGVPDREGGTIDMPLGPARAGSTVDIKIVVQVDGWPSRTDWRVVSRHRECALVSASPFTGRQHQIRVHLAAIGHPVIGDKIYGPDETLFEKALEGELDARDLATLGMERHALHNHRLVFRSPATGETVEKLSGSATASAR